MKEIKRGKLVCFEGIDMAGKTTVMAAVKSLMEKEDRKIQASSQFPDTPFGNLVYETINDNSDLLPLSRVLLYWTSAIEEDVKNTRPSLCDGIHVFSDRHIIISNEVYGFKKFNLSASLYNELCREVTKPDVVLWFHISWETFCERRPPNTSYWEKMNEESFNQFDKRYEHKLKDLHVNNGVKIVVVNADLPLESVIKAAFDRLLKLNV